MRNFWIYLENQVTFKQIWSKFLIIYQQLVDRRSGGRQRKLATKGNLNWKQEIEYSWTNIHFNVGNKEFIE